MVFKVIRRDDKFRDKGTNPKPKTSNRFDPRDSRRNWQRQLPNTIAEAIRDARFIEHLTTTIEPLT